MKDSRLYLTKEGLTNDLFDYSDFMQVATKEYFLTYCSSFTCAGDSNSRKGKKVGQARRNTLKRCPDCGSSNFLFSEYVKEVHCEDLA